MSRLGITGDLGKSSPGSFGRGFIWTLVLSILLCWVPILGPIVAGVVGGRKARRPIAAFFAGLLPALLWGGSLIWLSHQELKLGGLAIVAGPFYFYGPMVAACLVGGALLGSVGLVVRLLGAVLLAAGFYYFLPHANDMRNTLAALVPARAPGPAPETTGSCEQNLVQLYKALQFYTDDWDGLLPPAAQWTTLIKDKAEDREFHCPAVSSGQGTRFGYAMNPQLSGKRLDSVPNRDSTPLLLDSTDLSENAHAGMESLPKPGRHSGKDNVLYADGTVRAVTPP